MNPRHNKKIVKGWGMPEKDFFAHTWSKLSQAVPNKPLPSLSHIMPSLRTATRIDPISRV
jgi:hypothetical protein